ncbi:MAG: DUF4198 domain-containing protein [Akkermansiaceae bacterium]
MKQPKFITLTLALLASSVLSSNAHKAWINPSTSVISGENAWVTFDACISNDLFIANHNAARLESLQIFAPDGTPVEPANPHSGELKSTFDLQLNQKGTYLIQTYRSGLGAMWREGEKRQRWSGTLEEFTKQEIAKKEGVRLSDSDSKTVAFVTNGAPTLDALKLTGKGLEIDYSKSHPNDLVEDEDAQLILLHNGKPAAGLEITVIKGNDQYQDKVTELTLTTNEKGEFTVKWSGPGKYWLNTSTESDKKEIEGVPYSKRASYTATLEVLQS